MPKPKCFRLSEQSSQVIDKHAAELTQAKGQLVDRTEALEDIIQTFGKAQNSFMGRMRKHFQPDIFIPSKTLDGFLEGSKELADEQLLEAKY